VVEPFRHRHRVTYAECTVGNHIYHARYLDLIEAARGEFFRSLGDSLREWQERGVIFPVVEARMRYLAPARYDDTLEIQVSVTKAGGVRLNFAYHIRNENGVSILTAETWHACTGLDDKPRRLPEQLSSALRPHLPVAAAN
jgi:acyl-CoA thioester hydrolase